jgi:hypothetical protein
MKRVASVLAPLLGRAQGNAQARQCTPVHAACQHIAFAQHAQRCAASTAEDGAGGSSSGSSSIFVVNVEGYRNTSPLLIGIFNYLERYLPRPGFFQARAFT